MHINCSELTNENAFEVAASTVEREDKLTGLDNGKTLQEEGTLLISTAIAAGKTGCVIMMDLNGIQAINDLLGPEEGDRILVETTSILKRNISSGDLIARIGGDEFGMILQGLTRVEVATRLDLWYRETCALWPAGTIFETRGISAGTAWFPEEGSSVGTLMVQADFRMYIDKRNKRTRELMSMESRCPAGPHRSP